MTREEADLAVGKSISFRPYSLYADAVAFGQVQVPPRSVSAVVCEALDAYLERHGYSRGRGRQLAEVLDAAQTLGAAKALRLLRDAARHGAGGKKKAAHRR